MIRRRISTRHQPTRNDTRQARRKPEATDTVSYSNDQHPHDPISNQSVDDIHPTIKSAAVNPSWLPVPDRISG
jgi:hypothetical protein